MLLKQLNGVEKSSVAISLMLNHNLTGLTGAITSRSGNERTLRERRKAIALKHLQ